MCQLMMGLKGKSLLFLKYVIIFGLFNMFILQTVFSIMKWLNKKTSFNVVFKVKHTLKNEQIIMIILSKTSLLIIHQYQFARNMPWKKILN